MAFGNNDDQENRFSIYGIYSIFICSQFIEKKEAAHEDRTPPSKSEGDDDLLYHSLSCTDEDWNCAKLQLVHDSFNTVYNSKTHSSYNPNDRGYKEFSEHNYIMPQSHTVNPNAAHNTAAVKHCSRKRKYNYETFGITAHWWHWSAKPYKSQKHSTEQRRLIDKFRKEGKFCSGEAVAVEGKKK